MNDQDRALARRMLKKNRLSVVQVEQIRDESARTGRSFGEVGIGRGLLSAADLLPPNPTKISPVFVSLLASSAVIFAGLLFVTIYKMRERTQKDNDLAEESARMMVESERRSTEARRNYEQGIQNEREETARKKLVFARAAMTRAASKSSADATADLNEAFVGYNAVIEVFPQDPDLRIERSRVHEARRNYDRAVDDLERAIVLKKSLEPPLRDKIDQLKLLIARKPAK